MCMGGLATCMSVHYMCPWYLWRPEDNGGFPGTRVINFFFFFAIMWLLGIDLGHVEEHLKSLILLGKSTEHYTFVIVNVNYFKVGPHVAYLEFKIAKLLRITVKSLYSYFSLPYAEITGLCHHGLVDIDILKLRNDS